MNKRKMIVLLALIAVLVMACTCPVTNLFNSLLGKTQPEDLMGLVPDEIMENLPDVGELLETLPETGELLEAIPDELPGEAEEFLEDMPFLEDNTGLSDLFGGEVPENIPLVPNRNDDLMVVMGTVSYSTPVPLLEVNDYYRAEMAKLGWKINEDASSMDGEQKNATLTFTNDTQECWVSLYIAESGTGVAVIVADK